MGLTDNFARFLRPSPEGGPVARYGTARQQHGNTIIGGSYEDDPEAKPDPITGYSPRRLVIDRRVVVALTHLEARKYRREYDRAVLNGDLVECTANDYAAYLKADKARAAKATKDAEAFAKAETKAAAGPTTDKD